MAIRRTDGLRPSHKPSENPKESTKMKQRKVLAIKLPWGCPVQGKRSSKSHQKRSDQTQPTNTGKQTPNSPFAPHKTKMKLSITAIILSLASSIAAIPLSPGSPGAMIPRQDDTDSNEGEESVSTLTNPSPPQA